MTSLIQERPCAVRPARQRTRSAAPVVLHTRVVCGTGGGPDKTILNSCRFLNPHGYRAICAYMHPARDPDFAKLQARADACQARLLGIPDRGALDLAVVRQLLRICRDEKVTIWHGHDYKSNALGVLLRRFWPMRLVSTVHGWGVTGGRRRLYYAIDRLSLRFYDRVICVSDDLRQTCVASGVPAARCSVVENAIDTEQFARRLPRAEVKRRLGFSPQRLLIGAVGRLSDEKAFDRLIDAFDKLVSSGVDAELCIVGEGGERSNLERQIARLGLGDRVRLAGYQPDTLDWYGAMDVYALSSLREGLPNVLLEAMAMEVPIVATNIAGVPRLIADRVNGLLVPPDDVDGLFHALAALLRDPPLRERLAAAGRDTVETRYSFRRRMEKIRAVYDELLREPCDSP